MAGELLSTRAEADEAVRTVGVVQRDVSRLTDDRTSSQVMLEALRSEVATLKNVVNQHKLEKTELETIILSQRYSEHPGNMVAVHSDDITGDTHSSSGTSYSVASSSSAYFLVLREKENFA